MAKDSDVIVHLSVPGFETKVPPVFTRLGYAISSSGSENTRAFNVYVMAVACLVTLICASSYMYVWP
jgi:hypothetical protein